MCSVESTIFPDETESRSVQALFGEEREVMDAWREIRSTFEVPHLGMAL